MHESFFFYFSKSYKGSSDCVYRIFMRRFLKFHEPLFMLLLEHALSGLACPTHLL